MGWFVQWPGSAPACPEDTAEPPGWSTGSRVKAGPQRAPAADLPTDQFLEHPGPSAARAEPQAVDVLRHLQRQRGSPTAWTPLRSPASESCLPTLCWDKHKGPGTPQVTQHKSACLFLPEGVKTSL